MKILWVCGSRIVGGAERVTLQVAQTLRQRGHPVEVLCRHDGEVERLLASEGFPVYSARLGGGLNLLAVAAISRALDRLAPDVALVTTSDEWVWSCLARRRRQRTRLVLARFMSVPLAARVRWLVSRRADAVVAVSEAVRQSLIGRAGVPPERIWMIHNPVRFSPRSDVPAPSERARARAALGLPPAGRWVGFFGGLSEAKGIEDVLSAVALANQRLGATDLLVCGRSGHAGGRARFRERVRLLGLDERVHYLGEIDAVERALTGMDAVIAATRRRLGEALPGTLMEAMACGTPVLGYAIGGIAEVIGGDGGAGRLAKPDDSADLGRVLIELLADPVRAARIASTALVRVRQLFDPEEAADRYERLFQALCGNRCEPSAGG